MRSRHADYFNHDSDASSYDTDVRDEENPLRSGYRHAQKWIGQQVRAGTQVLDLGCGTGNTILALPPGCAVTAVDVSARMLEIARDKCRLREVRWVRQDILEYAHRENLSEFDYVVSAYSLHHLEVDEKESLFRQLFKRTSPTLQIAIADLMYLDKQAATQLYAQFGPVAPDVLDAFDDEYLWNIEETVAMLESQGWLASATQISGLSWAMLIQRDPASGP